MTNWTHSFTLPGTVTRLVDGSFTRLAGGWESANQFEPWFHDDTVTVTVCVEPFALRFAVDQACHREENILRHEFG